MRLEKLTTAILLTATIYGAYLATPTHAETVASISAATGHSNPVLLGSIEGSLSYPGEFVPPLKVCAENVATKLQYCTQEQIRHPKYTHGVGYRLMVQPGTYRVFATDSIQTALYSAATLCGLRKDCQDSRPLMVTVQPRQSITHIDPTDWFWSVRQSPAATVGIHLN
jgi:hypothetical protein